jgi:hypothetical protein
MFEKGSTRATIEWRFDRRGERKLPYAIIVRFHTSRDGRNGDVLVVSKVSETETCHVAYIDALANPDAIALARQNRRQAGEKLRLPPAAAHRGSHGAQPRCDLSGAFTPVIGPARHARIKITASRTPPSPAARRRCGCRRW